MRKEKECELSHMMSGSCHEGGIIYQVKALDHMLRRRMEGLIRESGFEGVSMINGLIIAYLAANEGKDIYQKDIEKQFKIGKSSLAGTLKSMEEKGYILRQAGEEDSRLKKVCITDKAKSYIQKIEQGQLQIEEILCRGIAQEELETFLQVVKKMQDNLSP